MSYTMIGEYTPKPLSYGVHHRCVQFVEFVEAPLSKYMGKDRSHETVLINMLLGSRI